MILEGLIDPMPLHKSIQASGIPIESVVIGKPDDRSTWRIVFGKEATEEQKKTAQAMLEAFDPNTKSIEHTLEDRIKALEDKVKILEFGGKNDRTV